MAPRRGAPSANSLSPPEVVVPGPGGASPGTSPRSASPSSGFTQFLSRPTKWFNRSSSGSAGRASISSNEPRSSTSSTGRKPKISHPTDPRPILDNLLAEKSVTAASRSVVDLSLSSNTTLVNRSRIGSPRTPSSPSHPALSRGLGDLRNISRKPWSKSADDLGKISSQISSPTLTPIDTTFHGKVEHYRNNRSESIGSISNAPSPSDYSVMSGQKTYPFPVYKPSEPLSTSPPQRPSVQLPSPPVSSTGAPLTPTSSNSGSHVHSRSHSFTPRLPSKLSSPKMSLVPPPSPKRKGSASSERQPEKEREKNLSGGSGGQGHSARSPFPFNLSGGANGGNKALSSPGGTITTDDGINPLPTPMFSAPPVIVEPQSEGEKGGRQDKRTSQVIYYSGFVNRLMDFSPSVMSVRANHSYMSGGGASTLSKGWKPFKLVLKGSKLYFYKPPSDRSAAVKELFPTELVAILEDEGLVEEDVDENNAGEGWRGGGKARDRDEARKKRAYWGRSTHPSLIFGNGIERGTFEALIHEAVFGTTFLTSTSPSPKEDEMQMLNDVPVENLQHEQIVLEAMPVEEVLAKKDQQKPPRYKSDWRDYSATVMFSLPSLVGRPIFEAEFIRCCSNLLNGAEEDVKAEESSRVCWLASKYLDYYGSPVAREVWEDWRQEMIPDFPSDVNASVALGGVPQSSSMQALYSPSPRLDTSSPAGEAGLSPNLGTFSPRPGDNQKIMSIVEALKEPLSVPMASTSAALSSPVPPTALRAALQKEGLTRNTLVSLDVQLVARSLTVFQRRLLRRIPDNLTADLCLGPEPSEPQDSVVPADETAANSSTSSLAPFVGSDDGPHWLTRMILIQTLLPEQAGAGGSESYSPEHRNGATSRTHSRSEVISVWAKVGEVCHRTGDDCSWRAISAALCSCPIARLDKVWKRVDVEALSFVHSWTQPQERTESRDIGVPKTVPWAGDVKKEIRDALDMARFGDGDEWQLSSLINAREKFEALRTTFSLCTRRSERETVETEDVEALAKYWQSVLEDRHVNPTAIKFIRVDQFMSLSLAAEPRRRGLFEPYYWTRQTSQQNLHPLAALLFPEPLPTVTFVNRELISRGRLESNASSFNMQELQHIREARSRPSEERAIRSDSAKLSGIDLGGTILPIYDGELLLLVQAGSETSTSSRPSSRAPSRPPSSIADSPTSEKAFSRSPSIRITSGSSQGLDRKPSVVRRNSLPSISQRTSLVIPEVTSERPLRVIVQAGTLDRLVDILVHGLQGVSVSVSDDNGEMPLNDKKTREVKVDMDDFSEVWWNVYRSFVTPQVLFEFLRKRYISAHLRQSSSAAELNDVLRARSEVLETLNEWINRGGGAQDALDDAQLYTSFQSFLSSSAEQYLLECTMAEGSSLSQSFDVLHQLRATLRLSFISQTMRPSIRRPSTPNCPVDGLGLRSFGSEIPNLDDLDAEGLVNNLDSMAIAAFHNINQEDLLMTCDLLEVQSADRTGWFLSREPNSVADEIEIQCMSSYIAEVEPSSMISELTQDTLYRLLPPSVRSSIRAFGILRKWLVSKLVALRLGLRNRQARMELMLRAIEICRLRSADSSVTDLSLSEHPCIRSFVEAVLTSAILSVESRLYHRAWQNVALTRGTACDTLSALLSKPHTTSVTSRNPLTVDVGWLMEKMVEIISAPDVLDSASSESLSLVNFDKRRSLYTLVTSASGLLGNNKARQHRHIDRHDFERLNNIEKELSRIRFDLRAIREDAHREIAQSGPTGTSLSKRNYRPFLALVTLQQEKNKRDRYLRDRLIREKRQEQQRHEKREEYLNKAMNARRPATAAQKQHRNKKSVSSAFLQFMRPISSAFSSENISSTGVKRSPAELDFVPTHKPSLVLSVVDAQVAQFANNERSFTFQLDTEDGGHYLLQAIGRSEMKKWMDTIEHVSKMAAKRRLTYLGQNSKMQLSDHLLSRPVTASRDPRAVFGVELDFLLEREAGFGEVQPGAIPSVVERLVTEVEKRGLTEIGIYRIAGAHSEVNAYKDALNRGDWPITSSTDIHAVCDLIKGWFRVLPGGIFPSCSYNEILAAAALDGVDLESRLSSIRKVVHTLPNSNFDLLKRIVEHLEKVTDYEENNQMTAESLATVFSPNLLRAPDNDLGMFFANMSAGHRVTKILIAHFHTIFDMEADQDIELDREQDDFEFDAPIPEEDEDEDILCDDRPETPDDAFIAKIPSEPPVLDVSIGSPHSFSFHIPS
ncbi:hypothetical protein AcV5_002181 [Taiwanofungus camphoratus]|nr:hypothetical protein AcV5_002181 [Antrodia cinnamomea]